MARHIPTTFLPQLHPDWYLLINKLPLEKQAEVWRGICEYPNYTPTGTTCWDFIASQLEHQYQQFLNNKQKRTMAIKMRWEKKRTEQTVPVVSKPENIAIPAADSKSECVENPFIKLTSDLEIIAALKDPNSGLSVFLATGQGYDDSLTRAEREFADRGDVRSKCKWHKELMAASKEIKKFKQPTIDEWLDYCAEQNLDPQMMRTAYQSYDVAGWHDSEGKPIRNWKQKILQVWAIKGRNQNRAQFMPKSKAEINREKSYAAYAEFLRLTGG